jgi:hypothetical protein
LPLVLLDFIVYLADLLKVEATVGTPDVRTPLGMVAVLRGGNNKYDIVLV